MLSNTSISNEAVNPQLMANETIHELFSCEKLADLAIEHEELCNGIHSIVSGGGSVCDLKPLLLLLCEQSNSITSLINLRKSFESDSAYLENLE